MAPQATAIVAPPGSARSGELPVGVVCRGRRLGPVAGIGCGVAGELAARVVREDLGRPPGRRDARDVAGGIVAVADRPVPREHDRRQATGVVARRIGPEAPAGRCARRSRARRRLSAWCARSDRSPDDRGEEAAPVVGVRDRREPRSVLPHHASQGVERLDPLATLGVVSVRVLAERSYWRVVVRPFTDDVSVSVLRLSGSSGSLSTRGARLARREREPARRLDGRARHDRRLHAEAGSGPSTAVAIVPSARSVVCVPSGFRLISATVPSGPVLVSRCPPVGRRSTRNVVVRPSAVVLVSSWPFGSSVRVRVFGAAGRIVGGSGRPSSSYS